MTKGNVSGQGPLKGVRVVDFGQYLAGPLVGMMLADQGADVVKVDPPEGPSWKHPVDAVLNRGKRRVALDLKSSAGREKARGLLATADVLVENFRPGVMERLGLGASQVTALCPRLVYLSLPGFSSSDAGFADVQAWEGIVAAAAGVFTDMSFNRRLYGKVPSYQGLALASADAAVLGAVGVLTALLARQGTGRGEIIEVPLIGALLECTAFNTMRVHDLPRRYLSGREMELARLQAAGEPCSLTYDQVDELHDPFYARYLCRDGRPFYVCCVGHRGHIDRLLRGLGLWEQLVDEGMPVNDPFSSTRDWDPRDGGDSVYAYPLTGPWASRIRAVLRDRFRQRTSSEWEDFFARERLPGVADKTTAEWLVSEHARAAGLVVEADDPEYGPMLQPGPAAWLEVPDDAPRAPRGRRSGDADRDGLVREPGAPLSGDAAALASSAAAEGAPPLRGLRILDLSNVIAGPTIGSLLARFGAECVKIDMPHPGHDPGLSVMYSIGCGRGKRSMLLDVAAPRGRRLLRGLVAGSDVVVFNGASRQLRDLGLDAASLAEVNPSIVVCRISAFGGPRRGPRSDDLGYDECAQAITGIAVRNGGGSLATAEETSTVGLLDNLCGCLGAYAVLLGLMERSRRPGAVQVGTSLVSAAHLVQLPYLHDHDGRRPFDEPGGPDAMGEHALYRLYRAADGWMFLGARRDQFESLRRVSGLADLPTVSPDAIGSGPASVEGETARAQDEELAAALAALFERRPVAEWQRELCALGIGVAAVRGYDQLVEEHLIDKADAAGATEVPRFVRDIEHPCGHTVDLVAFNAIRMKRSSTVELPAAPKFGAHTREILGELGLTMDQVDELVAAGVARESWGERYLPD